MSFPLECPALLPSESALYNNTTPTTPTEMDTSTAPRSEYLRRMLQERKEQRRQSHAAPVEAIPVAPAPMPRSTTPDSIDRHAAQLDSNQIDDEWLAQAIPDDEPVIRRHHRRRNSATPGISHRGTPTQEIDSKMSRLEKENYDLRLRVCMQEDRAKKLEDSLSRALDDIGKHKKEFAAWERSRTALEEENAQLRADNLEMTDLCEKCSQDAEEKIKAVDEAAEMIVEVEEARNSLQEALSASHERIRLLEAEVEKWKVAAQAQQKAHDSDYYSGDADSSVFSLSHKPSQASSRPSTAHQSDYFSGDEPTVAASRKPIPEPAKAPAPAPVKEKLSIKGRLQNLKKAPLHSVQRLNQIRERNSQIVLPIASSVDVTEEGTSGTTTPRESIRTPDASIVQQPPYHDLRLAATQHAGGYHPHSKRLMRSVYVEGELVGGLAQIRSPSSRGPPSQGADSTPVTPSDRSFLVRSASIAPGQHFRHGSFHHHSPAPLSPEPSLTTVDPQSPTPESPLQHRPQRRESSRMGVSAMQRPELPRQFSTPGVPTPTASRTRRNSGIVDRTTAWLGGLPGTQHFGRDYLFNRNMGEREGPRPFFTKKFGGGAKAANEV